MTNKITSLSKEEIKDFINSSKSKSTYKMQGHSFVPLKGSGKMYCRSCGLVALNNDFTRWCIDKGCNHEYHSQYQQVKHKFTKRKLP